MNKATPDFTATTISQIVQPNFIFLFLGKPP